MLAASNGSGRGVTARDVTGRAPDAVAASAICPSALRCRAASLHWRGRRRSLHSVSASALAVLAPAMTSLAYEKTDNLMPARSGTLCTGVASWCHTFPSITAADDRRPRFSFKFACVHVCADVRQAADARRSAALNTGKRTAQPSGRACRKHEDTSKVKHTRSIGHRDAYTACSPQR